MFNAMEEAITKRYLALAIEPIHIGSQGALPDASIARDVDGFPYIPASSLKGSVRALCSTTFGIEGCDGKGWHCPQPHKCPSCSIFGFANYHHGRTASSLVRFASATIVLVPIRSERGMLWVTSWNRLRQAGIFRDSLLSAKRGWSIAEQLQPVHLTKLVNVLGSHTEEDNSEKIVTSGWEGPSSLRDIYQRTLVLDELSLSSLVHHFTGLSTSIAVDGKTGHAKEGALFTIEYINRMSVLSFEIVYINPHLRGIREFINSKGSQESQIPADFQNISRIIQVGLDKLRFYGIGGKRSRGYGRLTVWETSQVDALLIDHEHAARSLSRPSRPHVFISYSSKNRAMARRLAADLQAEELEVWLDERKILVGDSIHRKVEEGITECDYLARISRVVTI
jgi:CRISPR type III-B/RAMP module RAMP protein Cmr4